MCTVDTAFLDRIFAKASLNLHFAVLLRAPNMPSCLAYHHIPIFLIENSESAERAVHERPHMFPQSKSLSPDNIRPPQTTLSHPRKSYSPQQNNRILRCLRPFASKHLVSLYHPFDPSPVGLNTRVTYAYLHLSFSIPRPISHSPHTQILRSHHTVPLSGRCSTCFSGGSGPIGESLGRYVPPSAHS